MEWERGTALVAKAMDHGAQRRSLASVVWDLAPKCQAPRRVELTARPNSPDGHPKVVIRRGTRHTWLITLWTKCRRCGPCLAQRQYTWSERARIEIARAARTWFGTLTLSPQAQFRAQLAADLYCTQRLGVDFASLPATDQFKLRHKFINLELTKWVKRVRKESRAPLRLMLVCEAHKSGLPHYHVLIHEGSAFAPVRKRTLQQQWEHMGFSSWKLVDPDETSRAARYVSKYLGKSNVARVRASLLYGTPKTYTLTEPKQGSKQIDPPPRAAWGD